MLKQVIWLLLFMALIPAHADENSRQVCQFAMELFKKHSPKDNSLDVLLNNCDYSDMNANQWKCMTELASKKHPFLFSEGQCFQKNKFS